MALMILKITRTMTPKEQAALQIEIDKRVKNGSDVRLAIRRALIELHYDPADVIVDGKPYHPSEPLWWQKKRA